MNQFVQLGQLLEMSNSIKSILNAVTIVWAITLYLNAGQFVLQMEDVFHNWQLCLARLLHNLPVTTGATGSIPTTVWYPD